MTTFRTTGAGLALSPLGAGDLIDRSVRFYRKNFWTFVLIASPPVVVGILFSVGWTLLGRNLFNIAAADPSEALLYQIYLRLGDVIIWLIQIVAVLVVMGGASRNFVRHLLFSERMTFRETYRNVKSRLAGLTVISVLLTLSLSIVALITMYVGLVAAVILVGLTVLGLGAYPYFSVTLSVLVTLVVAFAAAWLFFLLASRFVYVPQVMLVEGRGAFAAIGRSASLAGANVKRVAALSVFTIVAIYSALSLLYVPLSAYAWLQGVPLFSMDAVDTLPAWFEISSQVIFQGSLILILPVLMIGLCLLYVDERTRREGYDIELLAAARLGDMPSVPPEFVNPLQPALASKGAGDAGASGGRSVPEKKGVLGLD